MCKWSWGVRINDAWNTKCLLSPMHPTITIAGRYVDTGLSPCLLWPSRRWKCGYCIYDTTHGDYDSCHTGTPRVRNFLIHIHNFLIHTHNVLMHIISKSVSVKFSLIESMILLFTDSSGKKNFALKSVNFYWSNQWKIFFTAKTVNFHRNNQWKIFFTAKKVNFH